MFKKKKSLRIIAVSVTVFLADSLKNHGNAMENEDLNLMEMGPSLQIINKHTKYLELEEQNRRNQAEFGKDPHFTDLNANNGRTHNKTQCVVCCNFYNSKNALFNACQDNKEHDLQAKEKKTILLKLTQNKEISVTLVENCNFCAQTFIQLAKLSKVKLGENEFKETQITITSLKKKNIEFINSLSTLEKENSELKQSFNLLQQYFGEFQKKHEESQKELKECITSLQKENNSLKKLFIPLLSTHESELFNMSEAKFLNEGSIVGKFSMLYQSAYSFNNAIKNLKQKAKELGLDEIEDTSIISLSTQIISENQVPEYCVSILLKKDPQIFLPWASTKTVFEAMLNEVSLEKSSLPTHIFVEDEENKEDGILLSSYIKRELEQGLDAKISIEGKNNFKNMVSNIEKIQGNFWEDKEGVFTVPMLLRRLNEGDGDKEWVLGWSNLEEDYKKYVSATVLYKMSKRSLPKKYEDIESYLMDK